MSNRERWIAHEYSRITYKGEIVYIADYMNGTLYLTLVDRIVPLDKIDIILAFGPTALRSYLEEMGMRFG